MKLTTLKVFINWWNSIKTNDIAIIDVIISPRENNSKLFHPYDAIPYNTMNYLIRRQSERHIIIGVIISNNVTSKIAQILDNLSWSTLEILKEIGFFSVYYFPGGHVDGNTKKLSDFSILTTCLTCTGDKKLDE